jgi:hypothetical protein
LSSSSLAFAGKIASSKAFSFLSLLEENINLIPFGNSTAYLLQKL